MNPFRSSMLLVALSIGGLLFPVTDALGGVDGDTAAVDAPTVARPPIATDDQEPVTLSLDGATSVKRTAVDPDEDGAKRTTARSGSSPAGATPGWTTILFEDAEGSFPATNGWSTFDADPGNGDDYWDDLSCRAFSGSWSIWSADIGDQADCSNYDDSMASWMIFGPFSLADAIDARAEFVVWSETERPDIPFDYVFWGASTNGTNFDGFRLTVNTGWSVRELDLTNLPSFGDLTGESQVWIAFAFFSDSSVHNFEGTYLDEILIEEQLQQDLEAIDVFFRDQPGNAGNRIDSPTPADVLYPHFSYQVHGSAVSGKIWTIYLNGAARCSFTGTEPPELRVGWCNSPLSLAPGLHSLHGQLDPDGVISETDGGNNDAFRNYNVGSGDPEIRIEPLTLELSSAVGASALSATIIAPTTWGRLDPRSPEVLTARATAAEHLLRKAADEETVRVIVGFDVPHVPEGALGNQSSIADQRSAIAAAQADLKLALAGMTTTIVAQYQTIPFMALEVDREALKVMVDLPQVTSLEEDVSLPPTMASSNPVIGSPTAWAGGFDGSGQTVAILDTGVDGTHPFFATGGSKIVSEACYSSNTATSVSVCPGGVTSSTAVGSGVNCAADVSGCNHGTHVAGSVAGNDGAGPDYGVARGADLIAIQVFSRFNQAANCGTAPAPCARTFSSDQISGLERVFALRNTFDIAAANMSLGGGRYFSAASCDAGNAAIKAAIDNLRSVGIATVISTGNDEYPDSMGGPGCVSTAVSVGATTDSDDVAWFSNIAPFISLLAPGVAINSSVPGGGKANFQGTSMAAPHVSGAWALLKQSDPSLSVDAVLTALRDTGTSVDDNRTNGTVNDMRRINVDLALAEVGATGSFTIFNDGAGTLSVASITLDASAPWIDWTPDAPFDIPPGGSRVVNVTVDFPSAPNGESTRRLRVFSNDSDESPYPNGVFVVVTKTSPGAPDLIVTDVSVSNATPAPGQTFRIDTFVRNVGTGSATATTLRYYRSPNATISRSDTELSTDAVRALGAGESDTEGDPESISVAGTYWVGACVDSVAGESNTGNNCSSGVQVVVSGCTAADTLELRDTTQSSTTTYEACTTIYLGPNLLVTSSADLTLKAGQKVVFRPPVSIEPGARLRISIETP